MISVLKLGDEASASKLKVVYILGNPRPPFPFPIIAVTILSSKIIDMCEIVSNEFDALYHCFVVYHVLIFVWFLNSYYCCAH